MSESEQSGSLAASSDSEPHPADQMIEAVKEDLKRAAGTESSPLSSGVVDAYAASQPRKKASAAGAQAPKTLQTKRKSPSTAVLSPSNAQQVKKRAVENGSGSGEAASPANDLHTVRDAQPHAAATVLRTPEPVGVTVIEEEAVVAPNTELRRLLRAPR